MVVVMVEIARACGPDVPSAEVMKVVWWACNMISIVTIHSQRLAGVVAKKVAKNTGFNGYNHKNQKI